MFFLALHTLTDSLFYLYQPARIEPDVVFVLSAGLGYEHQVIDAGPFMLPSHVLWPG